MTKKQKLAVDTFKSDFNCAQSVLSSFSEDLGLLKETALSLTSGFGGGMGMLQKTCGAVSGAYMVISLYNSNQFKNNDDRKKQSAMMIQKFYKEFVDMNGTTNCGKLMNCDLRTEEGFQYAKDKNLFETVCEKCVKDSVEILEKLEVR
jgi:C_GCAxxG_C_C family probable redox protein